jgi:large subunit ribosomal protein L35
MEHKMPKLKTNRGAAKRFKRSASGKLMRAKAYKSHLLTKKSAKRKRGLRQGTVVDSVNRAAVNRMLPYI